MAKGIEDLTRRNDAFIVNVIQRLILLIVCVNAFNKVEVNTFIATEEAFFISTTFPIFFEYFCYCMCLNTYA